MILYEYVDRRGKGDFTEWRRSCQSGERAQFDQKIEQLEQVADPNQLPGLLAGTGEKNRQKRTPHIFKLRIGGKVRQRHMVCRGPLDANGEITLLYLAFELNYKLIPRDAPERADRRRQEILADPRRRRRYDPPD